MASARKAFSSTNSPTTGAWISFFTCSFPASLQISIKGLEARGIELNLEKIKELKDKAEKYDWIVERDAQGNEHYVAKLESQVKELQGQAVGDDAFVQVLEERNKKLNDELIKNKEIVEKIRELAQLSHTYTNDSVVVARLKQILGSEG